MPGGLGKGDSPDMALVIAGDTGRTTTLHAEERDFGRLWRLLLPRYTGTERVPEAWTHGRFPEVRVTVIWGLTGVGGWPQTSRAGLRGSVSCTSPSERQWRRRGGLVVDIDG